MDRDLNPSSERPKFNMPKDALGRHIELGKSYGYSRMSNGHVIVVTGTASKVNDKKVTLTDIIEKSGVYGELDKIKEYDRARSVYSVTLFRV